MGNKIYHDTVIRWCHGQLKINYSFLAALSLHGCSQGLSVVVVSRGYSCCGGRASPCSDFVAQQGLQAHGPVVAWCSGLVALLHVGSSRPGLNRTPALEASIQLIPREVLMDNFNIKGNTGVNCKKEEYKNDTFIRPKLKNSVQVQKLCKGTSKHGRIVSRSYSLYFFVSPLLKYLKYYF